MKKLLLLSLFLIVFLEKIIGQSYTSTIISGINEIAGTGTAVTLTASSSSSTSSGSLPVGFTFNFYGNAYTNFYINPTGTISFGSANQNWLKAYYAPQNIIPSTNVPNNFIGFAFINPYDNYPNPDLYPNYTSSNINYFTSGTAPNRILVVNFKNVVIPPSFPIASRTLNVQVQLSENDGKIEVHNTTSSAPYAAAYGRYDYLQIGLENIDGTNGTAATCPQNWTLNNQTVRFSYCSAGIPINVTSNMAICNATSQQTVNLSATCSSGIVTWYKDDGNCVASTGTLLTSTSVSPTVTTIYKARCEDGACNSGFVNTKITVTNSNPSVPNAITKTPTTNPISAGTSVTLSTYCSSGYYKWDDNSTLFQRVVTPNQTTTYYVKCLNGACESANISATVNVIIPPPSISSPTTVACSGTNATLTATGCATPDIVTWYKYDGNGGGILLGTGLTNIVNLSTTMTSVTDSYFATCKKNGVESNRSNYQNITVSGLPAAPTSITKNPTTPVNPNVSVILTANGCVSGNTIKWNDNSTANPRTVTSTITTTYSAKCVTGTCESATSTSATVDILPTITVTSPTSTTFFCSNAATVIPVAFTTTGTLTGSYTITLYKAITYVGSHTSNFTVTTATTATNSANIILPANQEGDGANEFGNYIRYYFQVTNGAIVSGNSDTRLTPRASVTSSFTGACGNQTATLKTQTIYLTGTLQWKKNGVNVGAPITVFPPVGPSATYTTTDNGTYTVDFTDNICTTTSNSIIFNQNTVPTIALTQSTSPSCTSTLTATGCLGTVNWYRRLSNGTWNYYTNTNPFIFTTSNIPSDFQATCTLNSCESTASNVVTLSPNFTEVIPKNPSICSVGGSILLNASSANSGLTYQWKLNGTDIMGATSSSYTAAAGGNYQVFTSIGACTYTSNQVFVNTVSPPTISITSSQSSPATITNGQSLVLTSNGCISNGGTVLWSTSETTSIITVTPSSNASYTFTCTKSPCVVTSSAFVVNVNPLLPPTITSSSPSTCTGTSVTLTATACSGGGTVTWSTTQTGLVISVSPSSTTSYTATCTVGSVTSANSSALSIGVFDGAITSLSSGNWTDASTWSCNCIPASCNDVTVDIGHNVIIPVTLTGRLKNLIVKGMVDMKTTSMMKMK